MVRPQEVKLLKAMKTAMGKIDLEAQHYSPC